LIGGNCHRFLQKLENIYVAGTYMTFNVNRDDLIYFNPLDNRSHSILHQEWDVVIHTGALTNVDECEEQISDSFIKTVLSTKIIVDSLKDTKTHFIYISTDYVFDGEDGPYAEDANPNPINIYGRHKLMAEEYVRDNIDNHAIVRVTNVFGEEERNKNFLARITQQVNLGAAIKIKVPYDQFTTPVSAYDIAVGIYTIVQHRATGIFHVAEQDYWSRYEIAMKAVECFGRDKINVTPVTTKSLGQKAARPLLGGLLNNRIQALNPQYCYTDIDTYLQQFSAREKINSLV
jgi:dTDP-4-dehydrorhamnose reductase